MNRLQLTLTYSNPEQVQKLFSMISASAHGPGEIDIALDDSKCKGTITHVLPFQEPRIETINGLVCAVFLSNF